MKKLFYAVALALGLAACNKEIDQHQIAIIYPAFNGQAVVFADHTQDSIGLITFDSYRCMVNGAEEWFTIDPKMKEQTVKYSYDKMWQFIIPVEMTPNTTGAVRTAVVNINNYGKGWNQTVQTGFIQYGWLNVSCPLPTYYSSEDNRRRALFELTDSATQVADSIQFSTEKAWTLASKQNLVEMDQTSGEGGGELVTVRLALQPNMGAEERFDTLLLQSSGVTTPIYVKQEAAKKDR